ncbi:MAG: site-specific DNA-methyltransferase [Veillonellales bacterium]
MIEPLILGDCTLYLGDCLEVMKQMHDKSIDAVVTDPPYGIDYMNAGGHRKAGWKEYSQNKDWDKSRPSEEYFREMLRIGKTIIIWGGNYFTDFLPPRMRWLIWDKGQRNFTLSDFEMAWTNQNRASRIYDYPRGKDVSDDKVHPTQKPISVMIWCMEVCKIPIGATVFDPFAGSGTMGVACIKTGRKFIGCEIEPTYYNIAIRRIKEAQLQMRLEL